MRIPKFEDIGMQFAIKLVIVVIIIVTAQYIATHRPSLAGLIAVMPLTGLMVMLWVWHNSKGETTTMTQYSLGAVLGIIPAILFFLVAFFCFRAKLHLAFVLGLSAAVWIAGALAHQHFLHRN